MITVTSFTIFFGCLVFVFFYELITGKLLCYHDLDETTMRHWGGYFKNKRLLKNDGSEHDIRRYSEMMCVKCKKFVRL